MKTFYIQLRIDNKDGSGTKIDPFDGEKFDNSLQKIRDLTYPTPDELVTINILDGHFKTKGVRLGKNWIIKGAGIDYTFIELEDVGDKGFHHPNVNVMGSVYHGSGYVDPVWLNYLQVSDLTLDANWALQSAKNNTYVKFAGLQALVTKALIQRIRVINWGSNGNVLDHAEAFPLFLETYGSEETQITIKNCIVEGQFHTTSGYCTAINVTTSQGEADRISFGSRKSISAIITGNKVIGVYGNAYGCGHSENVLWENNKAYGCLSCFNSDTGRNKGLKIVKNSFYRCNQGIHIGNNFSGPFEDIEITGNRFDLTSPWLNKYTTPNPSVGYCYGVRLGGKTNNTKITGNTFKSLYGLKGIEDYTYGIGAAFGTNTNWTQEINVFTNIKDIISADGPLFKEIT